MRRSDEGPLQRYAISELNTFEAGFLSSAAQISNLSVAPKIVADCAENARKVLPVRNALQSCSDSRSTLLSQATDTDVPIPMNNALPTPTGRIETMHARTLRVFPILCAILLFVGWSASTARAQGTPQLASVTPARGDTN